MNFVRLKPHFLFLIIIFGIAVLVQFLPTIISSVPYRYQLSSDAKLHLVHWREVSESYKQEFVHDEMFQLDTRPAGERGVNSILVAIGEFLNIELIRWSIIISFIALLLFLSGVYLSVFEGTRNSSAAFIVALGSIIPTFAFAGTSWGFLVQGFVPRELALALSIWLLWFYLRAYNQQSIKKISLVFFISGVLGNWYPVLFFHFVLVLFFTEILLARSLKTRHLFYLLLFFVGNIFALYDVYIKSSGSSPIDIAIFHERFRYMLLFSPQYAIFRYLRRFIIYTIIIGGIYYFLKKTAKERVSFFPSPWFELWIVAGIIAVIGIYLESYTSGAKFLFSRTSVWFLFSSMVLLTSAIIAYQKNSNRYSLKFAVFMAFFIFFGQSSIPTLYREVMSLQSNNSAIRSYFKSIENIKNSTPPGAIILAEPKNADLLRTYGNRGTYIAWKDGTIALLDGGKARIWDQRFEEVAKVFEQNTKEALISFAHLKNIEYLFYQNSIIKIK